MSGDMETKVFSVMCSHCPELSINCVIVAQRQHVTLFLRLYINLPVASRLNLPVSLFIARC